MDLGIVIGCSRYDDQKFAGLKYSERDAAAFASLLTSICGLERNALILLCATSGREATRNTIIRTLTQNPGTSVDRLFVFFSGHGFHSIRDDRDYLLPKDAVFGALEDTALDVIKILQYLRGWCARQTILFIDACRAAAWGGKAVDLVTVEALKMNQAQPPGFATFWSCYREEQSFESDALESGLFTHALLGGLGDRGKCSTVYELDDFLRRAVPDLAIRYELPQQTPWCQLEPPAMASAVIVSDAVHRGRQFSTQLGSETRTLRVKGRSKPLTRRVCGIDFGTSNSLAAVVDEVGDNEFVPCPTQRILIPSVVAFLQDWNYVIGAAAVELSRSNPERAVYNVKRALGTNRLYNIGGRSFTPETIASLIIGSLIRNVSEYLGYAPEAVIASRPANFSIVQSSALVKAFKLAHVELLRLVPEPSAAALCTSQEVEQALIVDLGGGTLDVAALLLGQGVFEILAASGDRCLGGVDYDDCVYSFLSAEILERIAGKSIELDQPNYLQLRAEAERVKIQLGTSQRASALLSNIERCDGLCNVEVTLNRVKFRELVQTLDRRVASCIQKVLGDATSKGYEDFRPEVILLGGQGSKLFTVRETLQRLLPGVKLEERYQETAVASGLGGYTAVLLGVGVKKDRLLLDVFPSGIGVKGCRPVAYSPFGPHSDLVIRNGLEAWLVSPKPEENSETALLLNPSTNIPTRAHFLLAIEDRAFATDGTVTIPLVEIDPYAGSETPLGVCSIEVSAKSRTRIEIAKVGTHKNLFVVPRRVGSLHATKRSMGALLELELDIDANHAATLTMRSGQDSAIFRINDLVQHTGAQALDDWPEGLGEKILKTSAVDAYDGKRFR